MAKVLLITGASSGIGEATAKEAVKQGYKVVATARSEDKLQALANDLGYTQFKYSMGQQIVDDHYVLFTNTGIPSIDIIDFQYPNAGENYWHTIQDIPENCSVESLEVVGTVMTQFIYRQDAGYRP